MAKKNLEKEIAQDRKKVQRKFAEQVATRVGTSPEKIEKEIAEFIDESRFSMGESTGKPPYRLRGWYEDFFNLIQERKVDKVSLDFIKHNIASGSEAYKFRAGLRFLDLIDKQGNPTSKLEGLRLTGENFLKNLKSVINQAYTQLFQTIVVEKARPESVINFIIEKYGYSRPLAEDATKLFVYFCQKADITISTELAEFQPQKRVEEDRRPTKKKPPSTEKEPMIPSRSSETRSDELFATLNFDEFTFSVKKDLAAIEFARNQVNNLLDYLSKRIAESKSS